MEDKERELSVLRNYAGIIKESPFTTTLGGGYLYPHLIVDLTRGRESSLSLDINQGPPESKTWAF